MSQRILINAFSAKLGGGKTYIHNLLARMPAGDYQIFIYLPEDIKIPENPRLHRLRTSWPTNNPLFRVLWEKWVLPRILKQHKIDLLFCPGGVHGTASSKCYKVVTMFRNMLPFDARIPSVSDSFWGKLRRILLKRAMLRTMTQADLVIFISEFARQVIESQAKIQQAVTIPHGISEQFLASEKELARPPLPFQEKYILYVSRFEFYKRHLEVVKAYQKLPIEVRSEYKLLLVGETNLLPARLVQEYVQQEALQEQVVFLGHYPYTDLPALYKNAQLFVFASACENCPNILLEAMGAGTPILSSNYEPMPEFGGNAVTYFNPDDPAQLSIQIQQVLLAQRSEKTEQLKTQSAKFSWQSTAQKTWELLLRL